MRLHPGLHFNEIAVLICPEAWDRYRAHVPAVFAELGDIPHHMVDVPLSSSSRLVEALLRIIDLPLGSSPAQSFSGC